MKFYKYHGAGNDFVLIDNRDGALPEKKKSELARKVCDRRMGVGGDGLVLVEPSSRADVKMRIFNPDGTEPRMCGNAIRCLAKHIYDRGIVRQKEILIETLSGIKKVGVIIKEGVVKYVRVEVGRPEFDRKKIPARGDGNLIKEKMRAGREEYEISALNVGVPHVVVFIDDVEKADVAGIGSAIRNSNIFPEGINVNFVEVVGKNVIKLRTYERGVEGETLACGTGASASSAVAFILGKIDAKKEVEVETKGGKIFIELEKRGNEVESIHIIGPVELVFEGEMIVEGGR